MDTRPDIDIPALKAVLERERTQLLHDARITQSERATVTLDQTSVGRLTRMDALQNQAMQLETERRREVALARIETALARIEQGEYGYCVSCGEDIAVKRLNMDPATPVCIDCAGFAQRHT